MGERALFHPYFRYGVEASGFFSATITMTIPLTCSAMSCDPRLLLKVSLYRRYRGSTIVASFENPRHSTHVVAPFSRAPLNLTIDFFVAVLFKLWRSCRSFFPRCAWRARARCNWPRGTTPTHPPPISRLVWLSSLSI